jgi:hypothetical protein
LGNFDGNVVFDEDFFAAAIWVIVCFKVEIGGFYMSIDDMVVLEAQG